MKTEAILSAGIDIGTSTTQLIFSRLTLCNVGGFGKIPVVKVISKEIIYESPVFFTPLSSRDEIDGNAVSKILKKEYEKAGISPKDLSTGAVIITGESSRKKNAREVAMAISEIAGDFVVASAGADMESVLAGKGSGAAQLSESTGKRVVNLDIGGGTTNICLFENGRAIDTACLDIGGRLVKIQNGRITYIAPKLKWLIEKLGINIYEEGTASTQELVKLTDAMADILTQSVGLEGKGEYIDYLAANHLLTGSERAEIITFSGGVADCMKKKSRPFEYGDIGVLLAESIKKNTAFKRARTENSVETMRATVIGAGNYSMNVSGSTIEYTDKNLFPLKNIPVIKVPLERYEDIDELSENIFKEKMLYLEENSRQQYAIAMKGLECPSFCQIQRLAQSLADCAENDRLIVISESDTGKALGQALRRILKNRTEVICIDGISCGSGDYVDMGEPVALGRAIPVVVKTLIFNDTLQGNEAIL